MNAKTSPDKPIVLALRLLRTIFAMQPRRFVATLCLTLAAGWLSGFGILLLIPMLDVIGAGGGAETTRLSAGVTRAFQLVGLSPTLRVVLLVFLVLTAGQALLVRWQTLLSASLQQEITEILRNRLYEAVSHCNWLFFTRKRSSDFTHALTADISRVTMSIMMLLNLISTGALVAVHVLLSLFISPWMSLAVLTTLAFCWPLLTRQHRTASRTGHKMSEVTRDLFSRITEHLAGMKQIKSLGAEARHVTAFRSVTESVKDAHLRYNRATANTAMVFSLGSAALLGGLLLAAVELLHVPLVELLVLIVIFARLAPRVRDVQRNYQQLLHMLPAVVSLWDLQKQCDAERENLSLSSPPSSLGRATMLHNDDEKGAGQIGVVKPGVVQNHALHRTCSVGSGGENSCTIQLRNVGFRYDKQQPTWALRDVHVTLETHRTTAVVGSSGAGKSTLVDVLMGLLVPDEGELTVAGLPLSGQRLAAWRQTIGYVPQDTFLLHDTVRANLLWADPLADEVELHRALQMAAADHFVAELPAGLDTVIGDRGVRLSGGERQRIALARALVRRPTMLILDEATSALDAENQLRIQEAVQRLQGALTVVIIAHRLSTVCHADRIVVLEKGRVVESGSYAELIAEPDGRFRSLAEADGALLRAAG